MDRSDYYTIDKLSIVLHAFDRGILKSVSVDEILLSRCMVSQLKLEKYSLFVLNSCIHFYLHSRRDKCLPLPALAMQ